jgi:hypothetical protein
VKEKPVLLYFQKTGAKEIKKSELSHVSYAVFKKLLFLSLLITVYNK